MDVVYECEGRARERKKERIRGAPRAAKTFTSPHLSIGKLSSAALAAAGATAVLGVGRAVKNVLEKERE
jgi:hypothetical protein